MRVLIKKNESAPLQVKASFWFAVCGFTQKAISLLTTPIFSRLLSTEEYGIFCVFATWQSIIAIVASLNLGSGVYLRGLIKFENDKTEFTVSLHSLCLLNILFVFTIYILFSGFWNALLELPLLYMYAMFMDIAVTVAFQFWSARQRVDYLYKNLIIVTLINAIIKPVLSIATVLLSPDKITARILTMVIVDTLVFGYFIIQPFKDSHKIISKKYWKYALFYNLPLIPHYLSQIILNQSDRIMINKLIGASDAGLYSLAYNAAMISNIVNQSILNSYNPWIYKKIKVADYNNIGNISLLLLLFVGSLNLILIAFAPEAIAILAPASYHCAVWVIPPVSLGVYFMFLYGLFANFEFYYEKTKWMMIASSGGALLNVILNYVFIKKYGFLAAGYTTLICYLFYSVFHYIVMRIILRKEIPGCKIYDIKKIVLLSVMIVSIGGLFMSLYTHRILRISLFLIMIAMMILFVKKKAIWLNKIRKNMV